MPKIVRKKVVLEPAILSAKHGGRGPCKSYCLYFKERPHNLRSILCVGCPDVGPCRANQAS